MDVSYRMAVLGIPPGFMLEDLEEASQYLRIFAFNIFEIEFRDYRGSILKFSHNLSSP
jgi:hypothetical protein